MDLSYLVIPILNHSSEGLPANVWPLADDISVKRIEKDDFALFTTEAPDEYRQLLGGYEKAIYVRLDSTNEIDQYARHIINCVRFAFNTFRYSEPIVISFSINFSKNTKHILISLTDASFYMNPRRLIKFSYKLKENASPDVVSAYFQLVRGTAGDEKSLELSLERYSSALTREAWFDKIIDLTIALESLIPGTTELRYRFTIWNGIISESDPNTRINTVLLLGDLYDVRSSIVHGEVSSKNFNTKFQRIKSEWIHMTEIASRAINYFLFFVRDNERESWGTHLLELIVGKTDRIDP